MNLSGLYELLERFHRSNQLPAFLIGFLAALGGAYFVLRFFHLRILSVRGRDGEQRALEKRVDDLSGENKQLQKDLRHTEKHAEVIKGSEFPSLSGRLRAQAEISAGAHFQSARQQLKERMLLKENHERRRLLDAYRKSRRLVTSLNDQLETIAVCDGRIWEARRR